MFARVSQYTVHPEGLEEGQRAIEEHLIPALRMQHGYNGGLLLANPQKGKVLAVSLWEGEQEMHATTRPRTGFERSVPKPSKARSQTSRRTRFTTHD